KILETTAFGACLLSGLYTGVFKYENLNEIFSIDRSFEPKMKREDFENLFKGWKEAIRRSLNWEKSSTM
ncbi:MAG: glycerol kinase, partial [Caldisericia bacterium]